MGEEYHFGVDFVAQPHISHHDEVEANFRTEEAAQEYYHSGVEEFQDFTHFLAVKRVKNSLNLLFLKVISSLIL